MPFLSLLTGPLGKLLGIVAMAAVIAAGGFYAGYRWEAAALANYRAAVATAAAKQAAANMAQQQKWADATAAADAKYQNLKAASDAQIADLSAAVTAGTQRLFVPTVSRHNVPRAATTAGRAHAAARPRAVSWHAIDPAVGARLVAIAAAGQRCIAQLTALQGWVRSVVK